jgi:hypothetical protein
MNNLSWLQDWYCTCANGDWEHQYGIKIETLDNPGWRVDIDVADTCLSTKPFSRMKKEKDETDWLHCWVENRKFKIACGPSNLDQGLEVFRNWVETELL